MVRPFPLVCLLVVKSRDIEDVFMSVLLLVFLLLALRFLAADKEAADIVYNKICKKKQNFNEQIINLK